MEGHHAGADRISDQRRGQALERGPSGGELTVDPRFEAERQVGLLRQADRDVEGRIGAEACRQRRPHVHRLGPAPAAAVALTNGVST